MQNALTIQALKSLKKHFDVQDISVEWSRPQDLSHGDTATPVCLQIAKQVGKAPKDIAAALAEDLQSLDDVQKAEVAGAGYVNVWLTPMALIKELATIDRSCKPQDVRKDEDPVIIEYSQPNIAKPLAVHHLLTTVIGQAISNLYEHSGSNTLRWNYIGDWGTQFGKLAIAVEEWGDGRKASEYSVDELLDLYVKFHEEAEKDDALEDRGRDAFRRLEEGDKELRAFWQDVVMTTKQSLSGLYDRLHVSFDLDLGESFYEDKMDSILEEGKKKNVFVEGERGALIVEFPEETGFPPYLVQKGDGATLYSTRDIAQMRYRIDTYHPKAIYIVTDIAQKLHFEQLIGTCDQLQWKLPTFENVIVGRMSFKDKSMSTRKGNVLKLEEVLDEAVRRAEEVIAQHGDSIQADDPKDLADMMGIGAVAYCILSQNRKMNLVFDWDKMLSFDGNSAPYLQYTHARARSVLRKAEDEGGIVPIADISSLSEKERALLTLLLEFPKVLNEAKESLMPHILTNYIFSLSQAFNTFYNAEPILKASEPERSLRLTLTSTTASVLKTGAEILTIRVPDRM